MKCAAICASAALLMASGGAFAAEVAVLASGAVRESSELSMQVCLGHYQPEVRSTVNRRAFIKGEAAVPILGYSARYGLAVNSVEPATQIQPTLMHLPFSYLRHGETDWNARGVSQGCDVKNRLTRN